MITKFTWNSPIEKERIEPFIQNLLESLVANQPSIFIKFLRQCPRTERNAWYDFLTSFPRKMNEVKSFSSDQDYIPDELFYEIFPQLDIQKSFDQLKRRLR